MKKIKSSTLQKCVTSDYVNNKNNNNNNNKNKNDDFYSAVTLRKAITRALTYAKR